MNPLDQQIAIAEATEFRMVQQNPMYPNDETKLAGFFKHDDTALCGVPDYLNDLNAINRAIANWSPDASEMLVFLKSLKNIVAPHYTLDHPLYVWCLCHATASQRSEAFLKTLGLWKP